MAPVKRLLDLEDFSRLIHVGDPQVSPDGGRVALVAVRPDLEKNTYRNEIWVYELPSGKTLAVLQGEGDSRPQWSPDGGKLLFTSRRGLAGEEKGEALYVYHLGGEPRRVYHSRLGFTQARWMPDSSTVLAVAPTPARRVDEDGDYVDIHGLPVWFDGAGFAEEYRSHILLVDYESGLHMRLTSGDYNVVYASPSPDGKRIAALVSRDQLRPHVTEVVLVDPETGETETLLNGSYSFSAVEWSPRGDALVLHGHALPRGLASHDHVWLLSLSGEPRCLTCSLDRSTAPYVSSDTAWPRGNTHPVWTGSGILFLLNEGGRVNIHRADPGTSSIERLTGGEQVVYSFTASRDGGTVAYARTSYTEPGEVWVLEPGRGRPRRLTRFNDWLLGEVELQKPANMKARASDGETVEGWYIPPARREPGKRYPVVLFIHGGPKACYGAAFNFMHQLVAAKGYYVVYCNPRGSDGYSEEYADIRCRYGTRDYQDIMEFLDAFLESVEDADPERIAVTGISYGGYMTNWIITQTSRFRAAVSENGISDWRADFSTSDIGYWFDPDQICGTPWDSPENYERASPINYVDRVETPVLIIHSMEDYRCFIDQAVAFHVALRLHGKESRLVVFTKGSHGHSIRAKPRHRMKRYRVILDYLAEKLKQEAPATRAPRDAAPGPERTGAE
ncbi:S9 family peptidase [Pyrodictium abyssi]|uniref:S9 family peptidase n=1 Tax=Pyrodictium abyssi TaxID=54256 RepID=A0ABM8J0I3_9CREN|nr:S9 family peptidase [Pyrodictium abyssi]